MRVYSVFAMSTILIFIRGHMSLDISSPKRQTQGMKRTDKILKTFVIPAWHMPKQVRFPDEPAHTEFANLGYNYEDVDTAATPEQIEMFFKRYGVPQEEKFLLQKSNFDR